MNAGASMMLADLDATNNDDGIYWCVSILTLEMAISVP